MDEQFLTGRLVQFKKGETLFRQGEKSHELYIIKSGEVRIYKTEGPMEIELDRAASGVIVGEIATIDGGVRCATGTALRDTEAYCLSKEEFGALTANVPDWFRRISVILAHRLREVDNKIDMSLTGDRSAHVAALITLIASTEKCRVCEEGYELNRKFLEHEIMDLLNMQITDISCILEKFASEKLIILERSRIILSSKNALEKLGRAVFDSEVAAPAT